MILIKTGIGDLYCENPNEREEKDRLKIYDSKKHYFDYFTVESILDSHETIDEFIKEMQANLQKADTAEKILDYFGIDAWTASTDWTDLLEDIYVDGGYRCDVSGKIYDTSDGSEITIKTILEDEYVNIIGKTYILVCD